MALARAPSASPLKEALLPHGRHLLERAMRGQGFSITGFALKLGVSRKHLSNVLGGKVPLGADLADLIAGELDLGPEHLRVLRHDGVTPGRRKGASPFGIVTLGDPTEPIPDWFEP
jgi:transcriptional regulator with XRE-family HTH domain